MKETRGKRFNSNLGYGYRASTKPTGKIIPLPEKSNSLKNPATASMKSKRPGMKSQRQGVAPLRKARQRNEDHTFSYVLTIGGSYYLFSMAFKIFNNISSTFESDKIKLIHRLKSPGFEPFFAEMFAVLTVFYFILYMNSRRHL